MAFYGFLRASEYTYPTRRKYDRRYQLLRRDITITNKEITLTLKRSKTDSYGKAVSVVIGATGNSTCPVRAMTKFLTRCLVKPSSPLFRLSSGHLLTRTTISKNLKQLLRAGGFNPNSYSSHSLRIGAATAAAESGLPDHLIKTLG